MTQLDWLSDEANKAAVYQVLTHTVNELQPDELPFLDGVYENYVDLARRGDVTLDDKQQPFNFVGGDDLITLWLIPLVIDVANSLILLGGAWALNRAIMRVIRPQPDAVPHDDRVRECVREALQKPWVSIDDNERAILEEHLTELFISLGTD